MHLKCKSDIEIYKNKKNSHKIKNKSNLINYNIRGNEPTIKVLIKLPFVVFSKHSHTHTKGNHFPEVKATFFLVALKKSEHKKLVKVKTLHLVSH